jgi:hypothetical protein
MSTPFQRKEKDILDDLEEKGSIIQRFNPNPEVQANTGAGHF